MSDTERDTPGTPHPAPAEGGDPACWLDQVCEICGRIDDRPRTADGGCRFCAEEASTATPDPDHPDGPGAGAGASGGPGTPGTDAAGPEAVTPETGPGPGGSVSAGPPPASRSPRRRDRDAEGRARNARPRDGLGRPLPYGALGVARQPEGVVRTPDATLTEAQRLLDAGMPFHAHEVLEDAWKTAPEPERALWRGLAQLAVGLTHAARANTTGAVALLDRGAAALTPYAEAAPYGIDVPALTTWARALTTRLLDHPAAPVPAAGFAPRLRA